MTVISHTLSEEQVLLWARSSWDPDPWVQLLSVPPLPNSHLCLYFQNQTHHHSHIPDLSFFWGFLSYVTGKVTRFCAPTDVLESQLHHLPNCILHSKLYNFSKPISWRKELLTLTKHLVHAILQLTLYIHYPI